MLDQEGWDAFTVVLGSDDTCRKGRAHYERIAAHAPDPAWTRHAITVGDSPADMRLGAEHGVPVRIGIDRDGDPRPLLAAGATHVVGALADILASSPPRRVAVGARMLTRRRERDALGAERLADERDGSDVPVPSKSRARGRCRGAGAGCPARTLPLA